MTITIVSRGKLPDRTLIGRCGNCNTVIECQPADAQQSFGDISDQRDVGVYRVRCPLPDCGYSISLSKKKAQPSYIGGKD